MALGSDFHLASEKFSDDAVSTQTSQLNEQLIKILNGAPKWYDVGAAKYRKMRENGETPLPGPTVMDTGYASSIPSREKGRDIPVRVFEPKDGPSKGTFMHIHGGGWVLQSEKDQDPGNTHMAHSGQLTVVSVGYRLAPEYPYPAGPDDCYDAAEWLVDNAKSTFGADLTFVGGESAGGHLSASVFLHLLKVRPQFAFKGLVLNYGVFDLSYRLPQVQHFRMPLVLTKDVLEAFADAYTPGMTIEEKQDPAVSPFYADLARLAKETSAGKFPPALFTVGTYDILLDDTMFMATKWMMTGSEAIVKIYPGAPHGFTLFPPTSSGMSAQYRKDVEAFLKDKA